MEKRFVAYDYIRAIAIIGVVALHTLSVTLQYSDQQTTLWWILNIVNQSFRWVVPAFVMLSGALLLGKKDEGWFGFYKKRLQRVIWPAVFWIVVFFFWQRYQGSPVRISNYLLTTVSTGMPYYHFYFVFVILGLYIFTPVWKILVRHLEKRDLKIFILLLLVLSMLHSYGEHWIRQRFPRNELLTITHFLPYLGYYFAGYYIDTYGIKIKKWVNTLLLVTVIAVGSIAFYLSAMRYGFNPRGFWLEDYLAPNVVISSFLFYLALVKMSIESTWLHSLLTSISKSSYTLYLSHLILLEYIARVIQNYWASSNNGVTLLLIFLITSGLSYLTSMVFDYLWSTSKHQIQRISSIITAHG